MHMLCNYLQSTLTFQFIFELALSVPAGHIFIAEQILYIFGQCFSNLSNCLLFYVFSVAVEERRLEGPDRGRLPSPRGRQGNGGSPAQPAAAAATPNEGGVKLWFRLRPIDGSA